MTPSMTLSELFQASVGGILKQRAFAYTTLDGCNYKMADELTGNEVCCAVGIIAPDAFADGSYGGMAVSDPQVKDALYPTTGYLNTQAKALLSKLQHTHDHWAKPTHLSIKQRLARFLSDANEVAAKIGIPAFHKPL